MGNIMHSNIKVGTIVNIMRVNDEFMQKIKRKQMKYDYHKSKGNDDLATIAKIELNQEQKRYSEFLDFYV